MRYQYDEFSISLLRSAVLIFVKEYKYRHKSKKKNTIDVPNVLQMRLNNTEVEGNWLMKMTKPLKNAKEIKDPAKIIDNSMILNTTELSP